MSNTQDITKQQQHSVVCQKCHAEKVKRDGFNRRYWLFALRENGWMVDFHRNMIVCPSCRKVQ